MLEEGKQHIASAAEELKRATEAAAQIRSNNVELVHRLGAFIENLGKLSSHVEGAKKALLTNLANEGGLVSSIGRSEEALTTLAEAGVHPNSQGLLGEIAGNALTSLNVQILARDNLGAAAIHVVALVDDYGVAAPRSYGKSLEFVRHYDGTTEWAMVLLAQAVGTATTYVEGT